MFEEFEALYLNEAFKKMMELKYSDKIKKLESDKVDLININIKNDQTTNPNLITLVSKYRDLLENKLTQICEDEFPKEVVDKIYDFSLKYFIKEMVIKGYERLASISGSDDLVDKNLDNLYLKLGKDVLSELSKKINYDTNTVISKQTTKTFKVCCEIIKEIKGSVPPIVFIKSNENLTSDTDYDSQKHTIANSRIIVIETIMPGLISNNFVICKSEVKVRYMGMKSMQVKQGDKLNKKFEALFGCLKTEFFNTFNITLKDDALYDILNFLHWDGERVTEYIEIHKKIIPKDK